MAVKIIIKRIVPKNKAEALKPLLQKLRNLAMAHHGYISGETLCNLDNPEVWIACITRLEAEKVAGGAQKKLRKVRGINLFDELREHDGSPAIRIGRREAHGDDERQRRQQEDLENPSTRFSLRHSQPFLLIGVFSHSRFHIKPVAPRRATVAMLQSDMATP